MPEFKDLFISYGRRESLAFAARLHQQLKLAGYDAWFDKINIPVSEDYVERINYGIESAHNFIYVMAPHSLCSPYCLMELEYARLLGKRIIPINHNVVFTTVKGQLSDAEQQALTSFYQQHDIENPHIITYQQLLERSLAQVGKTNWLPAKETLSNEDCDQLANWAKTYENQWHHHDDLHYLTQLTLPQFGEIFDELAPVITLIKNVITRHRDYVQQHTLFLHQALKWKKAKYIAHYLLVGREQEQAKTWLLTQFIEGEQAPCTPNTLVCDFICESRKNSENRMTDCFISYDQKDKIYSHYITAHLSRHGITTWRHDKDIQKGKIYDQVIKQGVESAKNLLFFLSPSSVESTYCYDELHYALSHQKRIIPLLIATTPLEKIPPELRSLQYVDMVNQTIEKSMADILRILQQDDAYFLHHRALLLRALAWQRSDQKASFLLRGYNLENAKTWLRLNTSREQYTPTSLHQELISRSEAAKGQLGTEIFISYSRKDGDFARKLNLALQEAGKTVWFDQESIATGVDFEAELYKGIDGADNFVFILSPDSVRSEYCESEVRYAESHCKRILTILARETDPADIPEILQKINWLDFVSPPFNEQFPELIQAIELDREHTHQHTIFQQRAIEWQENAKSHDYLLNHSACEKAEMWLQQVKNKCPPPTTIQQTYIKKSRTVIQAAEGKEKRRKAASLMSITIGVVMFGLAGLAWERSNEATTQRKNAEKNAIEATTQRNEALNTRSLYLAGAAQTNTEKGDPNTAIKLVLDGLPHHSETYQGYSEPPQLKEKTSQRLTQSLYDAVLKYWPGVIQHSAPVKQVLFNTKQKNKQLITIAGKNAYIRKWDKENLQLLHTLKKHESDITHHSLSIDGSLLATASEDKTVRIWSTHSGNLLHTLKHDTNVEHTAFSPIDNILTTASKDDIVHLWDTHTGTQLRTLKGRVNHSVFSPDGTILVTAAYDKTARLWNMQSGKLFHILKGHDSWVTHVAISPDGAIVSTASRDNTARLWDVKSGSLLHTLAKHTDAVTQTAFSPDGTLLSTVSKDKTARLWDVKSGKPLYEFSGHTETVNYAAFSPHTNQLITTSNDNTTRIWDTLYGELVHILRGHNDSILHAAFSPEDSQVIITASLDKTIRLWDRVSGELLHTLENVISTNTNNIIKNTKEDKFFHILTGHTDWVNHVTFSPDGKFFSTASKDKTVYVRDTHSGKLVHALTGHTEWVRHTAFSPDSQLLVTVSLDKTARIWDTRSGKELHVLTGHEEAIWHTTFSPNKQIFVTASNDNTARIWDSRSGQLTHILAGHTNYVRHTAFSSDGNLLVTASYDNTARIWETDSGQLLHTLTGHTAPIWHVDFSPDDQRIVTASHDKTAQIWDTQSGKQLHVLTGHTHKVRDANFSPDGKRIVTASYDNTARIWSVETGQLLHTLTGHTLSLNRAEFSPNGMKLLTSSYDNTARLWSGESGKLLYIFKEHEGSIYDAAFSPDSRKIVTVSEDKTARLWLAFKNQDELANYAKNLLVDHKLDCKIRDDAFLEELERCK